jgi:formylglycine-generating enzyme required for sulfatase activity
MAEFGKKPWAAPSIIEIQRFYDEKQLALQDLKAMQSLKSKNPNKAGIVWISITGGSFMGSQDEYSNEIPVHRVQIKSFDISKTEVTVGQYQQCVDAGVCSLPGDQNDHVSCNWGQLHRDLHPINCVDWLQARTFAKWVGGDLPTEAQWEYVARSQSKDFRYPWGNTEPTCEYAVMNDKWHDSYHGAPHHAYAWCLGECDGNH